MRKFHHLEKKLSGREQGNQDPINKNKSSTVSPSMELRVVLKRRLYFPDVVHLMQSHSPPKESRSSWWSLLCHGRRDVRRRSGEIQITIKTCGLMYEWHFNVVYAMFTTYNML